jgi:hypothetical protein
VTEVLEPAPDGGGAGHVPRASVRKTLHWKRVKSLVGMRSAALDAMGGEVVGITTMPGSASVRAVPSD